ncbi:ABC transporter ATP-binding protein [Azospirillum sp. B510]|uniref:ABC transporter ATP-binding protein n=1 Tax=Azospirillum sp. (strain B510) TaxID=137722 RepID=UPI0005A60248|nr:ABC transporter ATP-binding protein [Azospirillum sp. B510]
MDQQVSDDRSGGLAVEGVSLGYGRTPIIQHLTLPTLRQGTLTALIGPNGAGKSTLLRGLAGLGELSGRVRLDGADLLRLPRAERARLLGFMPQSLPPPIGLSVLESVVGSLRAVPQRPGGGASSAVAGDPVRRAYATLADIGIAELANRELSALSGGQRQLASLAQAVARRPAVLMLDEPTSALDLRHQTVVMREVAHLTREHGMVTIVVMHDIALAARHADRVAVLRGGALQAFGSPREAITARLLAEVYDIEARVETCSRGSLQIIVDQAL